MNKKAMQCFLAGGSILVWICTGMLLRSNQQEAAFSVRKKMTESIQDEMVQTYLPVFSFAEREMDSPLKKGLFNKLMTSVVPIYACLSEQIRGDILTAPVLIGEGEERKGNEGTEEQNLIEAIKKENEATGTKEKEPKEQEKPFSEALKGTFPDLKQLQDFETLVSRYYSVDSTTSIGRDQLDINKLMKEDMTLLQKDSSKPQILIYHTHSQEAFSDSIPQDKATTILGTGEVLANILREKYGYNVLHHMGEYDVESRDYAYANAAPALEKVLQENPDIEVIIDLHRDEMPEGKKLMIELEGRPTARFMFFNGLSRTNTIGNIDYLENPYINSNLAFSFQMQMMANAYYPGITRKIYLKGYRYNMQYRPKSLLIELGAQTNMVEEIRNACNPLAHVLHLVLSGQGAATGD